MNRFLFLLFLVPLLLANLLLARPFVIFGNYNPGGLFYNYIMVMQYCQEYENGIINGLQLAFNKEGFYYDPKYGDNWWSYYFEPIKLDNGLPSEKVYSRYTQHEAISVNERYQNFELINNYIHLKPAIKEKIKKFAACNGFGKDFIIGIHYRGTDKAREERRVEYKEFYEAIKGYIKISDRKDFKLFIASDEENFISYMKEKYPNKVCCNPIFRVKINKGKGLHYIHPSHYQSGLDALLDCYLLAKSNVIIRTESTLSWVSSFINPDIEVVTIR